MPFVVYKSTRTATGTGPSLTEIAELSTPLGYTAPARDGAVQGQVDPDLADPLDSRTDEIEQGEASEDFLEGNSYLFDKIGVLESKNLVP